MLERKVWPIFAWISGVIWAVAFALAWVSAFIDDRWGDFSAAFVIFGAFAGLGTVGLALSDVTYEKKPRGWRKERRRVEREAYIRRLEQELLND